MTKSPDAFRTISEVAAWLETPAHVLRFWESRFPELSPVKRAGGRRYYRPEDMQLLGGIKHLLHTEGHTIKSVQDRIKAEGTGVVIAFSPPLGETADAHADASEGSVPATSATPTPADLAHDVSSVDASADSLPDPVVASAPSHEAQSNVPAAVNPAASNGKGAQKPDDEIPPIGFFFDDSDDAEPAESQSGTFASADIFPPEAPEAEAVPDPAQGPHEDPKPAVVENQAIDVAADLPDDASLGTSPISLAARLRTLVPGSLSADQTARITPLVERLRALVPGSR